MAKPRVPKAAAAWSSRCRGPLHCGTMQPPPAAIRNNQSKASVQGCTAVLLSMILSLVVFDGTATTAASVTTTTAPLTASVTPVSISRHLLQTAKSPPPAPPPLCVGQCCPDSPSPPRGTPMVSKEWLSSQMAHGARIQIRQPFKNRWWRVSPNPQYANTVQCDTFIKPDRSTYFTVLRTSNNMIQLVVNDGRYVRIASSAEFPTFNSGRDKLSLTSDGSDPRTLFRIEPFPNSASIVFFRSNADMGLIQAADAFLTRAYYNIYFSDPSGYTDEQWEVRELMKEPATRGANLGSWITFEPWMNPALAQRPPWFSVDNTKFVLRSNFSGLWVRATNASSVGGPILVDISANTPPSIARFSLWLSPRNSSNFMVRTNNMHFWELQSNGSIMATNIIFDDASVPRSNMDFTFFIQNRSSNALVTRMLILAPNGMFLRSPAKTSINLGLVADVPARSIDMSTSARMFAPGPAVFLFSRQVTAVRQPGGTACWCLPWSYWCLDP